MAAPLPRCRCAARSSRSSACWRRLPQRHRRPRWSRSPTRTARGLSPRSRSMPMPACAGCVTTSWTSTSRTPGSSRGSRPRRAAMPRIGSRSACRPRSTRLPRRSTPSVSPTSTRSRPRRTRSRAGWAMRTATRCATRWPATRTTTPMIPRRSFGWRRSRPIAPTPRRRSYFGRLPSANCEVKAVEAYREVESPPAFYMPPTVDGSRQGQYYINTYQPTERQLHKIAAITFHEATPGHHFQIAIEMELKGLPAFRMLGSRMAGVAYVEGWGLYCERLADEMGLYARTGAARHARRAVVPRGAPRRRLRPPRHELDPRAGDRVHAGARLAPAGRRRDRGRPIHHLAGPGASYKLGQREIERARAEVSRRWGTGSTSAPSTTRCWPRLTAARHPPPRDPRLGRGGRQPGSPAGLTRFSRGGARGPGVRRSSCGHRRVAGVAKESLQLRDRKGRREVEALGELAPHLPQADQLLLLLNALRDAHRVQPMSRS